MKQLLSIAVAIIVIVTLGYTAVQAQVAGDFRSAAAGNWSSTATWETYDGANWNPAVSAPTGSETITITHAVTININIFNVTGYIKTSGSGSLSVNSGDTLTFSTGTYEFGQATGTIPIATWGTGSTLLVTGATGSPGQNDQDFYNITWNCASQSGNQGMNWSTGRVIGGTLSILSTGTGTQQFRMMNLTASQTKSVTINGNVVINMSNSGGVATTSGSGAAGSFANVTIKGNLTLTSGTLSGSQNSGISPTFNVEGDVTINGGTLTRGSFVAGTAFNFTKAGTQTFSKTSGTIASVVNFTVASGSTLDMGTSLVDGSTGTFTVSSGGGLIIGSTAGITSSGATGNIQVTGTRTFSTGGNYTYNAASAQVTGNGLPSTVNDLTLSNSSGVTMTGAALVNGTFQTNGGVTTASNLTFNGIARLNSGGFFDSSPTYNSPSTLEYNTGGTYGRGNEWNATSGAGYPSNVHITNSTTLNYPNGSTAARSIAGSLTIDGGSALYMDYGSPGTNNSFTVNGNLTLAGSMSLGDAVGGDLLLKGNWTNNGGTFNANSRQVEFNGSSQQSIGGTTATTLAYARVNNSAGLSLSNNLTMNNTLTLTTGNITTGSNTVEVGSAGSVSRTSGHIIGNLKKTMPSGAGSNTFEVGDASIYAPINVAASTTYGSPFTLTASTLAGDHSNVANSGIDPTKSVNRTYKLTGTPTGNSDVTFNFDPTDVDGIATPANFIIAKYDSPTWTLPTVGTKTATSTQATGVGSFSEFEVGEVAPTVSDAPVVNSPIAEGATSVSGTSTESNGTAILLYIDNSLTDSTTVSSNAWTVSGLTALNAGQTVKAKARATGEVVSAFSDTVTVQAYSTAPVVNVPVSTGATSVSGTSSEANGTKIYVYVDNTLTDSTTVSSNAWTQSGLTALTAGQTVKAKALASGKLESVFSNIVTVTNVLSISTGSPLPNATAGTAYSTTLAASGGTPPYNNWTVVSGSLPPNMSLNPSTGEISGTETVAGVYNFTVQVKDAVPDSATKAFQLTVNPGALHHFAIGTISSPQTAGTVFGITITAQDSNNNTVTSFTGTVSLTTTAGTISPTTSGSFSLGVRNENVTVTQSGTGKTISVDDLSSHTGTSNGFDVNPGALHHFAIGNITSPQTAGSAFSISMTAQDANNNTVTSFTGTVALSTTAGTISPPTSGSFSLGTRSENVTVTQSGTGKTISADDLSSHTGTSNGFDVNPGALDHFAIGTITTPQMQNVAFNLVMTAKDLNNNTVPGFAGTVTISLSSGTITPTTSGTFASGTRTEVVTATTAGIGLTIGVNDGSSHTGTSNSFDVNPPATILSNGTGGGLWNSTGTWQGGVIPSTTDSVVILAGDSVAVTANSQCNGLRVEANGIVRLYAKLTTMNISLNGYVGVIADTLRASNSMVVESAGVYDHARNGGSMPQATWQSGSTVKFTGITGNSPANARQTFHHVVWNSPGQTASLNLGWHSSTTGVDTTININGDITVLSTGAGRWQFCAPPAGTSGAHSVARVNIAGKVSVSGGSTLTGIGSSNGFTDIVITINGNVSVRDSASQLSISRGSQGGTGTTTWIFKGDSVYYGRRTSNQNSTDVNTAATTRGRFVFSKPGTQYVYVDSANSWSGECNMFFGDSVVATTIDVGNSQFIGSACTQRIKYDAKVIVGASGYIGGGTNTNGFASSFLIESGATLAIASPNGIKATGTGSSGAVRVSGTRDFGTAASFEYNGSSAQVTGSGLPSTMNNLTINNASGVTDDSTATVTVNGVLGLTSGALATGSNTVAVSSSGSVSRTSGHVFGNLQKNVATGPTARTFEIGDATKYTPVDIAFGNVTTPGDLKASTTSSDHSAIGSSSINSAKDVNRFWTLTNSGIVFTTYDATFHFASSDIDLGSNTNVFIGEKYNGSSWSPLTAGTLTGTSTQVTGASSFSEFAVGEPASFTITATAGANGTIVPSGSVVVPSGLDTLFTFNPDPGYHVDSVFFNGSYVTDSTVYRTPSIVANSTIHVTFAQNPANQYSLSITAVNGSVAKNPDQPTYLGGTVVHLTATPSGGYHFVNWTGDITSSNNPDSIVMDANKSVTAHFAINQYTITASATGGTINPNGAVLVNSGANQGFTFAPSVGYHLDTLFVDGVKVDSTSSYTFINVTATHTIHAKFVINTYTIVSSVNGSGTINPPGSTGVNYGGNQQYAIAPSVGHHLDSVRVDGVKVDSTTSYTFINVTAGHTIAAYFSINQYTLSVVIVGSGSVQKNPDQATYSHGTSVQLIADAVEGWMFSAWSGDATGSNDSITVVMDGAKNITATFVLDPAYQVKYRSFAANSIPLDQDNKGKPGKYVVRKADKAEFSIGIMVDSLNITDLHVEFGSAIDTVFPITTIPPSTASSTDPKLKKWDFVFTTPRTTGDSVHILGFGWTNKGQKISKYWWTRLNTQVGKSKKDAVVTNQLRLPMPNRINALFEAMTLDPTFSTTGMVVGKNWKTPTDSSKYYGWFQTVKYGDILKTLHDKTGYHGPNTGRPFDVYTSNGKPITKQQKSLPPAKQNNSLLANMIALRLNITASALGKTPNGFGELLYNDGGSNSVNGLMVKEIASLGDSVMMGYQKDTVDAHNKPIKSHRFLAYDYVNLDSTIRRINDAFEGAMDTVHFWDSLVFKGTHTLLSVPILHGNPNAVPARIVALAMKPSQEVPSAYTLYQNYPNPFNPTTTIQFDLPASSVVTLKIYNILGQEVATLFNNQTMDEGQQIIDFNASNLASGVYFYRLTTSSVVDPDEGTAAQQFSTVKKMLLVK